jgi:23S rRNA (cytosine1962-C5)-methyltransferase
MGWLASPSKSGYFDSMEKQLVLRKKEEHRIIAGHQWIFSNEIASLRGTPQTGDVIEVRRYDEKILGYGFYNAHSLIACRLLSASYEEIDHQFFERKINQALSLRQTLYPKSETFRLVHGESDFLPGLIIDKYNEFISIQTLSAGMDMRLPIICDVLESIFHPKAIVARNDVPMRTLEGLPAEKSVLRGNPGITIIDDAGVKFEIDVLNGQKTGFFLDQRENRRAIRRFATGKSVLDCFCNEGGFAIHASAAGAKSVKGLDVSEQAIAKAKVNARLNSADIEFQVIDAFDALKAYGQNNTMFDVVILDPPSFTKSRKNVATALHGYKEINGSALRIIRPGGFLVTASCSHHISEEDFLYSIDQAGLKTKRSLQLLHFAGAAPDHPVIPVMPETKYLKFAIFSVI